MYGDINGLHELNNREGHEAGDELIRGAAACITQALEDKGRTYRIGGDEFCVLLENADREAWCAQEFERWLALRREVVHCLPRVSLGAAPISGEDLLAVKDQADREMYRYKSQRKASAPAEGEQAEKKPSAER